MTIDLTRNGDLLISRYQQRPSGRIIRNMLATLQELMGDPVNLLTNDLDEAQGAALDNIGLRMGFTRPPIIATDIPTFGYQQASAGYGRGVYATSRVGEAANLPVGPMPDAPYRSMLKARGVFLRGLADRDTIELALTRCFGSDFVRLNEQVVLSKTQSVALVGLAEVNGAYLGITANGHRYAINPFDGSYRRLTGDLPARTYSSLSFSDGDLFAISGNQYYEVEWGDSSVTLASAVTMTGMPSGSVNVSGPVSIGPVQYVATPTTLYTIDTEIGGSVTSVGSFSPATDIRALGTDGSVLYGADASGAIRTIATTDAKTALYHSTGSTAVNALLIDQGAFYAARSRSLIIVDGDVKGAALAYTADIGHSNPFFLASFLIRADRLVPSPAGVGRRFRTHQV